MASGMCKGPLEQTPRIDATGSPAGSSFKYPDAFERLHGPVSRALMTILPEVAAP